MLALQARIGDLVGEYQRLVLKLDVEDKASRVAIASAERDADAATASVSELSRQIKVAEMETSNRVKTLEKQIKQRNDVHEKRMDAMGKDVQNAKKHFSGTVVRCREQIDIFTSSMETTKASVQQKQDAEDKIAVSLRDDLTTAEVKLKTAIDSARNDLKSDLQEQIKQLKLSLETTGHSKHTETAEVLIELRTLTNDAAAAISSIQANIEDNANSIEQSERLTEERTSKVCAHLAPPR